MKRISVSNDIVSEAHAMVDEGYLRQDVLVCSFMAELDAKTNEELAEMYIETKNYSDGIVDDLLQEKPNKYKVEIVKLMIAFSQLNEGYKDQLKQLK